MTPEQAREIDRHEFAAEAERIRQRGLKRAENRKAETQAKVDRWLGREQWVGDELWSGQERALGQSARVESHRPRSIPKQQHHRRIQLLNLDGEAKSIGEWSSITSISVGTIRSRLKYGWTVEQALSAPVARTGRPPTKAPLVL